MVHEMLQKLSTLGLVQVGGPDARSFLNGQVSHDLQYLTLQQTLLASCSSPQGRVQVVLILVERREGIFLIVPAVMAPSVVARLRKYVLRAKVTLDDASRRFSLFAASSAGLRDRGLPLPAQIGGHLQHNDLSVVRWRDRQERYLVLTPTAAQDDIELGDTAWRLADIRAGLPQVFPETHESFVAQMLNLDLLDGISFSKGCYTGQEVIARTHYRGAIKRRMFRLQAECPPPAPGVRILAQQIHAGEVVMSAPVEQGCELLAVLSLSQANEALELEAPAGISLRPLPLPYDLPLNE